MNRGVGRLITMATGITAEAASGGAGSQVGVGGTFGARRLSGLSASAAVLARASDGCRWHLTKRTIRGTDVAGMAAGIQSSTTYGS